MKTIKILTPGLHAVLGRTTTPHRTTAVATAPVRLTVRELHETPPIVIGRSVHESIRDHVGAVPAEAGGPLGGTRGTSVVSAFAPDPSARTNGSQYYPDVAQVNELMRSVWNPAGINLLGFVHSHPRDCVRPSSTDASYAGRIMAGIPELPRFLLPIVQTVPDTGSFRIAPWSAERRPSGDPVVLRRRLEVVEDPRRPAVDHPRYDRVRTAYDVGALARSRFVSVGCGGSASFLEDLARTGVGEFVLIDPDRVEAPNLGTQQTYVDDIGRPKVEVVGERLLRVNPDARVWVVRARLEDLDDHAMDRLARDWLPGAPATVPGTTVLGAFTDDFHAQARVARLGLHLGLPVVGATVYEEGWGVELTFAAPGITSACIRCAQRSRYVAHLERGFRNGVTSRGTPYSATTRLNALKLPVVLGLLHATSPHADAAHPGTVRHRAFVEAVAERNLVLVNLHPEAGARLGVPLLDAGRAVASGRLAVDTATWLHQLPDHPARGFPACPDCGGTGDLGAARGTFTDTSPMPLAFGEHRTSS